MATYIILSRFSIRAGWAFGTMHRLGRFGLFPSRFPGCRRRLGMEVQFPLDVLPLVAPEIHVPRRLETRQSSSSRLQQ